MTQYDPHAIEAKWRERWPRERMSYQLNEGDAPYYCLDMFSYPSGEGLHMGHWRPYTIADVWSRYQTLLGKKVLHPVGFDSFGLPAENHAIKTKTHPAEHTHKAISNFKRQLGDMGTMYDWSTYLETSSPEYYRWTQWLFIQLYKHGLAYRKAAQVNWCPSCQTVLANEQVISGRCERCGTEVIKKELRQWFLKITDFADELLNFDGLDWPERVKTLQREWIGKSEGAELTFHVKGRESEISVFTTRADTLFGVTYIVLAPEHPMVDELTTEDQRQPVQLYQEQASKKTDIDRMANDKEKTGVFTGSYAINPATNEVVPIWIADYVLATYGTGAVMAVPAHDDRDHAFATTFSLPIKQVISSPDNSECYTGHGLLIHSGEYSGMKSGEAAEKIVSAVDGKLTATYRLRDWLVSRQRYWGAPIPIIYCDACGEQAVPENDLPVLLPQDAEFMPTGGSPLERHPSFKHVHCPRCGGTAVRDTDTLDTFVDSSWYYLRYTDPHNASAPFSQDQVKAWLPVDMYVGGIEHAILHLLYARFMMKALHKLEIVPYHEPFQRFVGNGMVYLNGQKMSKSKGNVVNPDEIVVKYGTDAMRGYICFMGPIDQDVEWQSNGIVGIARFLDRAWRVMTTVDETKDTMSQPIELAYTSVSELLPKLQYNRCISALMSAINTWGDQPMSQREATVMAQLMAPFFPHFAEEVWEKLGHTQSIFESSWPRIEVQAKTHTTYAIQVNGKTRATIAVPTVASEEMVTSQAQLQVLTYLSDKSIIKTIVIPGRIVNFVVQ